MWLGPSQAHDGYTVSLPVADLATVTDDGRVVGMLSLRDALAVLERERMVGPRSAIEAVNG